MKTTDIIKELVEKPVFDLGYELVDIEFIKEQAGWVLTLYIDKEGGVTLDDCERVSREVEVIIDKADPIDRGYYLSVSSPGIDRPFKTQKDYEKNIGKDIIVKLYAKHEGKKEYIGKLLACEKDKIKLGLKKGETLEFLLKDIAQARPDIVF